MLTLTNLRTNYRKNPLGISTFAPTFSWELISDENDTMQISYELSVFANGSSAWSSGKVSSDNSNAVNCGIDLLPETQYTWTVKVYDNHGSLAESSASFETGIGSWSADWIYSGQDNSIYQKAFSLSKTPISARLYATALGIYLAEINGKKAGDLLLTPYWTNYKSRIQYQTYDVTSLLTQGDNILSGTVSEGWFKGRLAGWMNRAEIYGDTSAFLAELHILFADGTKEIIKTDSSWLWGKSQITKAGFYYGEDYDARIIPNAESPVKLLTYGYDKLIPQESDPVREIETIQPIEIIQTPNGETVIDFGQNLVGYVRFRVNGKFGDLVTLRHGEILDNDGNFYDRNLRSAKQIINYTLRGGETETYSPAFTFQGFRYVLVEAFPEKVTPAHFEAVVIHSDLDKTGSLTTSDPMINKLIQNTIWGQKGNFVDVPTDCPQRDERLGWTGDLQVFCRTATFNMDVYTFLQKWLCDLASEQYENGAVPHVIPHVLGEDGVSSAAWADAATIVPWNLYLAYGNKDILKRQFDSMKAWVEYMRKAGNNEFLWNTGEHYGDWLGLDAPYGSYKGSTDEHLIATAFFAHSTKLTAKAAEVLGLSEEVKKYETLYQNIVKAYQETYIIDGKLTSDTQTAHVVTIWFELAGKYEAALSNRLIELLEKSDYHLETGFVGTPYLCFALTKIGRLDLAYQLLEQKTYPSWLYPITKGATTIWEHWDGIKPDGTRWSDDMNSFNHYAYGAICEWIYRVVCGIDTDETLTGYKKSIIAPKIGGSLTKADCEYKTTYGLLGSSWEILGNKVKFKIIVPPNTTAKFIIPSICVGGGSSVACGSGTHEFELNLE